MATLQSDLMRDNAVETDSRASSVPLLGEGFTEITSASAVPTADSDDHREIGESLEQDPKSTKRRFWNLGKKKDEAKPKKTDTAQSTSIAAKSVTSMPSPAVSQAPTAGPQQSPQQKPVAPASPGRNMYSPSPRLGSPASSQIFERNVQEDGLYTSASPAIPAHITTENHIPSVLDASSVAITDDQLDPDNVEIVMHAAHQPAAVTVTGTGISEAAGTAWQDDLVAHPDNEDAASNYGALDSTDVRRLSFISFADVVHAEQADHSSLRDSVLLSGANNIGSPLAGARSPSPIRSPVSPPTSSSPSFRGLDTSPSRGGRAPGSPRIGQSPPTTSGELTIETMRQALRKTGSGDLSGARSQPMSATGNDDGNAEHSFR